MLIFVSTVMSFFLAQAQNGQTASHSDKINLYELSAEALDTYEKVSLGSLKGKPSFWVLFQPDCQSCKKLMADLSCLPKDSETRLSSVAMGFWGTKDQLQKTMRGLSWKGLKLVSTKQIEDAVQLKNTPTLLFVSSKGFIKNKITHRIDCQLLKNNINELLTQEKK